MRKAYSAPTATAIVMRRCMNPHCAVPLPVHARVTHCRACSRQSLAAVMDARRDREASELEAVGQALQLAAALHRRGGFKDTQRAATRRTVGQLWRRLCDSYGE